MASGGKIFDGKQFWSRVFRAKFVLVFGFNFCTRKREQVQKEDARVCVSAKGVKSERERKSRAQTRARTCADPQPSLARRRCRECKARAKRRPPPPSIFNEKLASIAYKQFAPGRIARLTTFNENDGSGAAVGERERARVNVNERARRVNTKRGGGTQKSDAFEDVRKRVRPTA